MERRSFNADGFSTREDSDEMVIEGYFVVFDDKYEFSDDAFETVDPSAFDEALDDDIRALINHDTSMVLGRTKANTLTLRVDEKGLFGSIKVNPNDTDATNLYSRVQRGDVNQCSFGFDILAQETEVLENQRVHFTIKKVRLYEVSVCTFPAYESTGVAARCAEADSIRELEVWKVSAINRLKNGGV